MTTRNPNLELPPDVSSVIAEVNFTTTRAGLTGQVFHVLWKMPLDHTVVLHMVGFMPLL